MTRTPVLFLNPVGEKGGADAVLLELIRTLCTTHADAGFTPHLICLRDGPVVDLARKLGAKCHAIRPHRVRQLHRLAGAVRDIAGVVRREGIALIHCSGPTMLAYGATAARGTGARCIWHVFDPLESGDLWTRCFTAYQRRLRPAATVFGTRSVASSYLAIYPYLSDPSRGCYRTILPGVETETLMDGAEADRARRRHQLAPEDRVAVMLARMQRYKGAHDLIDAAALVVDRLPAAKFLICGGVLHGVEPKLPEDLRSRIASLGLEANVHLTGYLTDQERADLLAAAHVLVHPAHFEPFGVALIEGMAAGLPVVATDCEGPREIVVDGETGLIVPKREIPALAGAIASLLGDPPRATAMGLMGKERANRVFSVETMADSIVDLYREVLAR